MLTDTPHVIEHGTSRPGRWLRARRNRIALSIALVESIIVVVFHDDSRFTVIGLGVLAFILYWFAGRTSRSDAFRQASWIFAASQLLAVLAAILAFILLWTAILAAVVFAAIALFFVLSDRR
jgi:thiol:disulfide interchange protein